MKEVKQEKKMADTTTNININSAEDNSLETKHIEARRKQMIPMKREEYEAQQKIVREVYDPESGRYRLIRGTGEIVERIVSRHDHERINKIATRGDGTSFAKSLRSATSKYST